MTLTEMNTMNTMKRPIPLLQAKTNVTLALAPHCALKV